MNYAITGASGFIGGRVLERMRSLNFPVTGYTRSAEKAQEQGLIRCQSYEEIAPADVLLHFAENRNAEDYRKPDEQEKQLALIDFFLKGPFKKIVFASSAFVYPASVSSHSEDETIDLEKLTHPYARYKLMAERRILSNPKNVVMRFSNVYGKGMSNQNVLSDIIKNRKDQNITVRDASPVRDFIYIDDAVEAVTTLASSSSSGIYNISSGKGTSVKELIQEIAILSLNAQYEIIETDKSAGGFPVILDNHKLKNSLKWTARFSLREGLSQILEGQK